MADIKSLFFARRPIGRGLFTMMALLLTNLVRLDHWLSQGNSHLLPYGTGAALIWSAVALVWVKFASGRMLDANIRPGWSFPYALLIVGIRPFLPDSLMRDLRTIAVPVPLL